MIISLFRSHWSVHRARDDDRFPFSVTIKRPSCPRGWSFLFSGHIGAPIVPAWMIVSRLRSHWSVHRAREMIISLFRSHWSVHRARDDDRFPFQVTLECPSCSRSRFIRRIGHVGAFALFSPS